MHTEINKELYEHINEVAEIIHLNYLCADDIADPYIRHWYITHNPCYHQNYVQHDVFENNRELQL